MKALISKITIFIAVLYSGLSCEKDCKTCEAYDNDIPPIANAGPDITISYDIQNCSYETIILDSKASSDPDGKINNYKWQVIAPYTEEIGNRESKTFFNHRGNGEYLIQLQVYDNQGKDDFDTVKVTVKNDFAKSVSELTINLSVLADIPARFFEDFKIIGGTETKLFLQGSNDNGDRTNHNIAMLDIQTQQWKEIKLSQWRDDCSIAVVGEKIFFAGGGYLGNACCVIPEKTVDIYNMTTGEISINNLSVARTSAGVQNFGTKIYFIGGVQRSEDAFWGETSEEYIRSIEMYDTLTKSWSLTPISEKASSNYVRVNNKLYFLGNNYNSANNILFVFDLETNSWSEINTNISISMNSVIAEKNNIYWLGDLKFDTKSVHFINSTLVNYNTQNRTSTFTCLPEPNNDRISTVLSKNNKIMVLNPYDEINNPGRAIGYIYNTSTGAWHKGKSANNFPSLKIKQFGNEIFAVANNKIYRVDF